MHHIDASPGPTAEEIKVGLALCQATRAGHTDALPAGYEYLPVEPCREEGSVDDWLRAAHRRVARANRHWGGSPAWQHFSVGIYRRVTETRYQVVISVNVDITQHAVTDLYRAAEVLKASGGSDAEIREDFLDHLRNKKRGGHELFRCAVYPIVEEIMCEHAELVAAGVSFEMLLVGTGLGASWMQSSMAAMYDYWQEERSPRGYPRLNRVAYVGFLSPGAKVGYTRGADGEPGWLRRTFGAASEYMLEFDYASGMNLLGRSLCRRALVPRSTIAESGGEYSGSLCFGAAEGGGDGAAVESSAIAVPQVATWEAFYRDVSACLSAEGALDRLTYESSTTAWERGYGPLAWLSHAAAHSPEVRAPSRPDKSDEERKASEVEAFADMPI